MNEQTNPGERTREEEGLFIINDELTLQYYTM